MPLSVNEGLWRIGGQYGEVVGGNPPRVMAEVVEITATIEINRIEMPLVGTTRTGYKPGRETREGTFRVQKIDSFWELFVHRQLSQSLGQRRANRNSGVPLMRAFNLVVRLDDPDALGYEAWQLEGCILWRLPLGFNIGDDLVDREFPFTWEKESPIASFVRTGADADQNGLPDAPQRTSAPEYADYPTL